MSGVRKIRLCLSFLLIALTALFEPLGGLAQSRELRVVNTSAVAGQTTNVSVELVSQGNENAIGFSLNFNPTVLSNPSVSLGSGATGATLNANTMQAANGRVGVAIALPAGMTFTAGVRQVVSLAFSVAANAPAGAATLIFGDQPVAREIADATANTLATTFTSGAITVTQPNPNPELTSINPTSAVIGTNGVTLTVNGNNFVNGSTVRWNGSNRTTAFVSGAQLTAAIPASDLTVAGTVAITVANPAPGGGVSNSATFTINQPPNPAPSLASIIPSSAIGGGPAFTLTVDGANFVDVSVVRWNNADRVTAFVSSLRLTAQIPSADLATTAGSAQITIFTPAPGGGTSSALAFTITQPNPAPTLTGLSPASSVAGGGSFPLTANGTNFINGSVIRWKDADRPTTFVSSTQLRATIPASDLVAGPASIKVFTPAPGGGVSSAVTFNVFNSVANVSAASFLGDALAPESIIAAFGVNLATGIELAATQPLPTTLLGTTVKVKDSAGVERDAPLFFVAPAQINYLVPPGTAEGAASMTVVSNSNIVGVGQMPVAKVGPGLISANSSGQGVAAAVALRVAGSAQTFEPVSTFDSAQSKFVPLPIDLGPSTDEVYLILYGTGFRGNSGLANVKLTVGGVNTPVLFAGAAPGFTGLDQCNAGPIPRSLAGRGVVDVALMVDGKIANVVQISIK